MDPHGLQPDVRARPERRPCSTARRSGWPRTSTSTTGWRCGPRCSGPVTPPPGSPRRRPTRWCARCHTTSGSRPPAVNVRDQRTDPDSLLNWFERLIRLRKEAPEIGWGRCTVLPTAAPRGARPATTTGGSRTLVTVHNLGRRSRTVELRLEDVGDGELRDLLRPDRPVPVRGRDRQARALAAHDHRWFRIDVMP